MPCVTSVIVTFVKMTDIGELHRGRPFRTLRGRNILPGAGRGRSSTLRAVELRPITIGDLPLYERALTSPEMIAGLGGPLPREGLREKLEGIVRDIEAGLTGST